MIVWMTDCYYNYVFDHLRFLRIILVTNVLSSYTMYYTVLRKRQYVKWYRLDEVLNWIFRALLLISTAKCADQNTIKKIRALLETSEDGYLFNIILLSIHTLV